MMDVTPNLGGPGTPNAAFAYADAPIVVGMTRDGWTFISNHGHVLVCLAADPEVLVRDVAASIGITERAVQQIIGDLERAGVVARVRVDRRNHYLVRRDKQLRHPVEQGVTVGSSSPWCSGTGTASVPNRRCASSPPAPPRRPLWDRASGPRRAPRCLRTCAARACDAESGGPVRLAFGHDAPGSHRQPDLGQEHRRADRHRGPHPAARGGRRHPRPERGRRPKRHGTRTRRHQQRRCRPHRRRGW